MEPLTIRARLQAGYVASDDWSPALDGILAAMVLREQLGEETYALGMSGGAEIVTPELPLERDQDDAGHWWWCVSSPVIDVAARHDQWFHRRYDFAEAIDRVTEKTRRVQTQGGPFKAYRNRETVIVPRDGCVHWHAIGDRGEIERLLRRCTVLGKGGARGRGVVLDWAVTPNPGAERLARDHRPLPVDVAIGRGLHGPIMRWGLIPPGRHPDHQCACVMP